MNVHIIDGSHHANVEGSQLNEPTRGCSTKVRLRDASCVMPNRTKTTKEPKLDLMAQSNTASKATDHAPAIKGSDIREPWRPDAGSLPAYTASHLESTLLHTHREHDESLIQMEACKKREMEKIRVESLQEEQGSLTLALSDVLHEENCDNLDLHDMCHLILALQVNNQALGEDNDQLQVEIQQMKDQNTRLLEHTSRLCHATAELKEQIEVALQVQTQLQEAEVFLQSCIQECRQDLQRIDALHNIATGVDDLHLFTGPGEESDSLGNNMSFDQLTTWSTHCTCDVCHVAPKNGSPKGVGCLVCS